MNAVYPEPDFEGFDGIYAGTKAENLLPLNEYDLHGLVTFLLLTGKKYEELTQEEIDHYRLD